MSHDPLADLASEADAVESDPVEGAAEAVAATAADADTAADCVTLGDSLTIPDVAGVMERLRAALDLGGALRIDGSEVEQLDAAGVQLLCAAVKDARARPVEVFWQGVSDHLREASRQLGLARELGI